ncbi:NADH-quinone oxidoreductase subunit J [Timonella senegalensis]|uniref:NADH-quinone oxidoreductase subunit J n=1 Tax=Timonella senegalensis TaxID=1465825 RepID=UPI0028A67C09|nr:NADH-quinone oxidoreductase subunit J [Timonella senegalensis]
MTSGAEAVLFWCLAPLMVLAALGLIFARKAVHATICMVFVMISLAVMYIANQAPFLGIVQIVVYTGAVMMLFLFVIMLVGVDAGDSLVDTLKGQRWIGWLLGIGLGVVVFSFLGRVSLAGGKGHAETVANNPAEIARVLLGNFVFPLELVGVLLVTAAIAALTMTHRRNLTKRIGQKELADTRVASGARLTPLPSPGVFAQRNAMDVPALDPHGQPVEASVSRVLRARGQERDAIYDPDIELLDEAGRPAPSTWDRSVGSGASAPANGEPESTAVTEDSGNAESTSNEKED